MNPQKKYLLMLILDFLFDSWIDANRVFYNEEFDDHFSILMMIHPVMRISYCSKCHRIFLIIWYIFYLHSLILEFVHVIMTRGPLIFEISLMQLYAWFACADMHDSCIHFYGFTALPATKILDIKSCSSSAHSANWFKEKSNRKKCMSIMFIFLIHIYTIRLIKWIK